MPLRNRVDPFGHIHAVPEHGELMGNRGCLHGDARNLLREHGSYKAWISCNLVRGDRRQTLMAPGLYTQLFFRDEATAMAAGHRPCFECRRTHAKAFVAAWGDAHGVTDPRVPQVDAILHAERLGPRPAYDGRKLPDGAMIGTADEERSWLAWRGTFRPWSFAGYGPAETPSGDLVLLTPPSMAATIEAGYKPAVHASVTALP
ncbi:hypothetical protein HZF05_16135 [Sphingomonas sp. CGMCC 1.13654]|uniref:Uncharacterized protein n=1 Tax=Sphingomonas chungangi TaxID=2683589 RepID=A0A838LA75_9SPHN|nr:hypothetical protein [Sphingomonas chungangi]MBA2935615.1 hypothetical protein [Sphingomonas chungangi]MVW54306.1 hypothetical protein [Sphingomonas chungangi]